MPVICDWFDETANIIIARYVEKWTTEEFVAGEAQLQQYLQQVRGRFDIIADLTQSMFTLPVDTLRTWITLAEKRDSEYPNWGITALVIRGIGMEAYFETGSEISPSIRKHCRMVTTLEDAVRMIRKNREVQAKT